MKKIYFMFGIHNHQPVGNFPGVLEQGYAECYWPFAEVLSRHPKIKWSLHCTGILWDFFRDKHPEFIKTVKKMSDSGQVEHVAGGYYEPIMPVIPDRDKIGQIKKHRAFIKDTFGGEARGLWLAERVWEPHLSKPLAEAGIEYTVVDDTHFAAAGLDPEKLKGYYLSEEQGVKLKIFPISKLLRYSIPFHTVEKNLEYFRNFSGEGNPGVVMFDDGEKFGMWPETNKHSYKDRWLENFLEMLEANSSWIETITYSEYINRFGPEGRVYLPAASYMEMSEWALPPDSQEVFGHTVKRFKEDNSVLRFLRGGFWRNFLTKYEESNNMHKKMLYVSAAVDAAAKAKPEDPAIPKAYDSLYSGQCNCAYWHGVFGGLYLPHLRNGIYHELIKTESILRGIEPAPGGWKKTDFDCDGLDEMLYEDNSQNIYVKPLSGGSLFEWDILPLRLNASNVLTRRKEGYHQKLKEFLSNPGDQNAGVQSIHDIVKVKEAHLDEHLNYDWYRKTSLLDHFLHPSTKYNDFRKCKYGEQGDFVLEPYSCSVSGKKLTLERCGTVWVGDKPFKIRIKKSITPSSEGYSVKYSLKNEAQDTADVRFAVEFNLAFSESKPAEDGEKKASKEWARKDGPGGFETAVQSSEPCDFWPFPVETVSLSEFGFERTYQGTTLAAVYPLKLAPGEERSFELKTGISKPGAHHKKKALK